MRKLSTLVVLLFGIASSIGCENALGAPTPPPPTAEEFCAAIPTVGFGNFFYCGTVQANLDRTPFPDGAHGYCMTANTNNIGLVGYSAYTYSGGATPVESQSAASEDCKLLGSACGGYIRCTRK